MSDSIWSNLAESRPTLEDVGPSLVAPGPMLVNRSNAESGQQWSTSAQDGSKLVVQQLWVNMRLRPNWANIRPRFGQLRPGDRMWSNSVTHKHALQECCKARLPKRCLSVRARLVTPGPWAGHSWGGKSNGPRGPSSRNQEMGQGRSWSMPAMLG